MMIVNEDLALRLTALTEDEAEQLSLSWLNDDEYADGREVERCVEEISQGVWAAGHMQDVEYDVWDMIQHPEDWTGPHPYCTDTQLSEWIASIKLQTIDKGRFFIYDVPGRPFDAQFISLPEWETRRRAAGH